MNMGEMIGRFRIVTGDKRKPYFWDDPQVATLINKAYIESVDRGLMIFDRESFTVEIEPGVQEYALDQQIIRVKEAAIISRSGVELDSPERLRMASRKYDFSKREWSDPQGFVIDEDGLFILADRPTESMTISLAVYRYPELLEGDKDEPVIPEMYHAKMLNWAYKLALGNQDADTFSQASADKFDAEFTRTFGPSKTAQQHRQRRRNSARSIKTPSY